jgi:hypothetical protein
MILPELILSTWQNESVKQISTDTVKLCLDKKLFDSYPDDISYNFNSRGFRDDEWPESIEELQKCIWCFGDSQTMGTGNALDHTWFRILQNKTDTRCINISMEGASNDWIVRKINQVLAEISPQLIVVQWSFLHRTEDNNINLDDEQRRIAYMKNISTDHQIDNFKKLRATIDTAQTSVIESFNPKSVPIYTRHEFEKQIQAVQGVDWPDLINMSFDEVKNIDITLIKELEKIGIYDKVLEYLKYKNILPDILKVEQIDYARDGYHYGPMTAEKFVDDVMIKIKSLKKTFI